MTSITEAIEDYPDVDDVSREAWVLEIWELESRQRASELQMEEWVRSHRCLIETIADAYYKEINRRQVERSRQ